MNSHSNFLWSMASTEFDWLTPYSNCQINAYSSIDSLPYINKIYKNDYYFFGYFCELICDFTVSAFYSALNVWLSLFMPGFILLDKYWDSSLVFSGLSFVLIVYLPPF